MQIPVFHYNTDKAQFDLMLKELHNSMWGFQFDFEMHDRWLKCMWIYGDVEVKEIQGEFQSIEEYQFFRGELGLLELYRDSKNVMLQKLWRARFH